MKDTPTDQKNTKLRLVKAESEEAFRNRLRSHRAVIFLRVLLSVLAIAGIVAFVAFQYKLKTYTDYEVVRSAASEYFSKASGTRLGENFLMYGKDGARCCNTSGEVVWDQTYEMQNPIFSFCRDTVAFGDYNGRTVYIYNSAKQLGTIQTNLPIRGLAVAANGVVAAIVEDTSITWIYVYDADGNELLYFRTTMENTGYPISISMTPDAYLCAISYVHSDGKLLKDTIAFYNFDEYGKNQIDNLVGGYDYTDTLIPYVQFINSKQAFVIGDESISFFAGAQKPELTGTRYLENEIKGVYYSDEYVGLVEYHHESDGRYALLIYTGQGELIYKYPFSLEYSDVVFDGDNFIIYNEEECIIATVKGREKYHGPFREQVNLLIPLGNYRYALVTDETTEIVQMK